MTIKELIEELSAYPEDTPINFNYMEFGTEYPLTGTIEIVRRHRGTNDDHIAFIAGEDE